MSFGLFHNEVLVGVFPIWNSNLRFIQRAVSIPFGFGNDYLLRSVYKGPCLEFVSSLVDSLHLNTPMKLDSGKAIEFKIAQPDTTYLIGSNSIDSSGDLYILNSNNLSRPENLRSKRFIDLLFSILLIFASPVFIWFFNDKYQFISNLFSIAIGKKSFVGCNYLFNIWRS
jgi:hypothetical protein